MNYEYKFNLISVIDGDTIDVSVELGFGISIRIRVRLAGVDAPEIHNTPSTSPEHIEGIRAKMLIQKFFRDSKSQLVLKIIGRGYYRRWLGVISEPLSGRILNEKLRSQGWKRDTYCLSTIPYENSKLIDCSKNQDKELE